LWREIEELPVEKQGGRRILLSPIYPDREMDFEAGGYVIRWADAEGVPAWAVLSAFGIR